METVFLTIHLIIAIALVAAILLQRSEGGALGIGGGSSGGFMTARGAGDALSKTTKWLAVAFLANSLFLGWLAANKTDDFDRVTADQPLEQPAQENTDQLPDPDALPEPGEG